MAASQGPAAAAAVLLGVGLVVKEVYCCVGTSSLCDIFLGVEIHKGIRIRVCGCHIDM